MLYRAKQFYQMSGVKRSTLRHYQEKGLITPSRVDANGYAYYSERQMIDLMLIKNYRGVDYEIDEIAAAFSLDLNRQIDDLDAQCRNYERQIAALQKKLTALQSYNGILKQCRQVGQLRYDAAGRALCSFFIRDAMQRDPAGAVDEIAHCVSSFPFVHIAAKGSLTELRERGEVSLVPGYEYSPERQTFRPLHESFYQRNEPSPCLLLRLCTADPLKLKQSDLEPIFNAASEMGATLGDTINVCISGMVKRENVRRYYVSARVTAAVEP